MEKWQSTHNNNPTNPLRGHVMYYVLLYYIDALILEQKVYNFHIMIYTTFTMQILQVDKN